MAERLEQIENCQLNTWDTLPNLCFIIGEDGMPIQNVWDQLIDFTHGRVCHVRAESPRNAEEPAHLVTTVFPHHDRRDTRKAWMYTLKCMQPSCRPGLMVHVHTHVPDADYHDFMNDELGKLEKGRIPTAAIKNLLENPR